jgi:uncharacterized protein YceK
MKSIQRVVVALAIMAALGGCGSSKNNTAAATTTPTTAAPTTTTAAPTTTTTVAPTTTTAAAPAQSMTVTPNSGLKNGQTVHIVGIGYTPGKKNIGVTECADKGNNTGAGDCDLHHIVIAIPDASGKVTVDFAVNKGPFGSNNIVCSSAQPCLLSVGEETATPTESATLNITFA